MRLGSDASIELEFHYLCSFSKEVFQLIDKKRLLKIKFYTHEVCAEAVEKDSSWRSVGAVAVKQC